MNLLVIRLIEYAIFKQNSGEYVYSRIKQITNDDFEYAFLYTRRMYYISVREIYVYK